MKNLLLDNAAAISEVRRTAEALKTGGVSLNGVSGPVKTVIIAALDRIFSEQGSLAFLVSGRDEIREYRRSLNWFYPNLPMYELYPADLPRVQADAKSREVQAERVGALRFLRGEERGIVFVTAEALLQKLPDKKAVADSVEINCGEVVDQQALIARFAEFGYERTQQVDAIGQFCVRGDILDIFPINSKLPLRIEWFDDTIDAIRSFSLENQRSVENLEQVKIVPLEEPAQDGFNASVFDYAGANTLLFVDDLWTSLRICGIWQKKFITKTRLTPMIYGRWTS